MGIRMQQGYLPNWLRELFLSLSQMYDPGSNKYMNYKHFMTTSASLALLLMLAVPEYEDLEVEVPPTKLEFDMGGSITLRNSNLLLEGGEVKSSFKGV